MKPQCNTSADCLRELARVMDQFWIVDIFAALRSKYCKWSGGEILNAIAALEGVEKYPDLLTCAIAEVEGKPVFPYQEGLYAGENKFVPVYEKDGGLFDEFCTGYAIRLLSWTPPKPATVMVELPIEAALTASKWNADNSGWVHADIAQACKTALEKLKS